MSDIPYSDTPQPVIPVLPEPDMPTPVPEVEPDPSEEPDLPPESPGDDVPKVGLWSLVRTQQEVMRDVRSATARRSVSTPSVA